MATQQDNRNARQEHFATAGVSVDEMMLEELIADAESAAEPGMHINEVISRGSPDLPAPTVVSSLTSAGYSYMYDTRSGERSLTNNNMLPQQLTKNREDGSRVFTTIRPNIIPSRGSMLCLLHQKNPSRGYYDSLGLNICPKANLTSEFQVIRHMQTRHKLEWQTIETERARREKLEERDFQVKLLQSAAGQYRPEYIPEPTPVVEQVHIVTLDEVANIVPIKKTLTGACPDCAKVFVGKSEKDLSHRITLHARQHPEE